MEAVIFKGVSFAYPKCEYSAISDVDFSVNKGELCLIIGESAVGKTTLLKLLKKEIAPSGRLDGKITVNGTVGYVAQNVDESIVCDKVRGELSFGLTNMGLSGDSINLLVAEAASYFNLESKLDCDISSLSGGEKQMLNLASIMVMKPDILVLDEPCSQLDPIAAKRFVEMVLDLHRDFGITVIIAEHSAEGLFENADSIALMQDRRLLFKLPVEDAVSEMKRIEHGMPDWAPLFMTVLDDCSTVYECREKIKTLSLKSLPCEALSGDIAMKVKKAFFAYEKGNDVITDLNLKVYSGKINAIVGPNSSGKTTLLKLMSGVLKHYRGRVKTDKRVSMLCQNVHDLFTKDTCGEEVEFGELTEYLGISDIEDKHPYDLSGGQAQRLALAKVLATGADILLLDEPTKGLDPMLKKRLAALLSDLCNKGKTILLVTHDIEFAGRYADVVSFISRGSIINTASRREFFSSLSLYTTAISKITNGFADNIVSIDDFSQAGGLNE